MAKKKSTSTKKTSAASTPMKKARFSGVTHISKKVKKKS